MTPKDRPAKRGLFLVFVTTLIALALVLYPLKGRGAGKDAPSAQAGGGAAGADAPPPKPKKPKPPKPKDAPKEEPAPEPAPPPEPPREDLTTIPIGKGLPVNVQVAVFFLEVTSIDDAKAEFQCTTDMRLRWTDPRLAFPKSETLRGYREFLGKAAEEKLGAIWTPNVDVKNRLETAPYVGRRVRIFPDGTVESMTRITGKYKMTVNAESFPFDRQRLPLELIVRDDTTDEVLLRFDKGDVEFSRIANDAKIDGWEPSIVDLSAGVVPGWNGDRYSTATATLFVDRLAASSIASVFIPLLASLIIPLLALWMNRATDDGFAINAHDLANMGIGGLFSVIALNFAIYSASPVIATTDNTVTRLFALNYAMLALTLATTVVFFRFELPRRLFGIHVQKEAYKFLTWATPVLALAMSVAFLLVAAA